MNRSRDWVFPLTLLLALLIPATARAHGGGELYVVNAPVGDYLVSVSTAPVPLQVNAPIHVTVSIADSADQTPVLDGRVLVTLFDAAGKQLAVAPATTEQAVNKLFYETDFAGVAAGEYRLLVAVSGAGGNGELEFWVRIAPAFPLSWLAGGLVLLLLTALVFWYRSWRRQHPPRRGRPPRRPAVSPATSGGK